MATERSTSDVLQSLRHDIRTRINHILGYCELLLEELAAPNAPQTTVNDLRRIHAAATELLQLADKHTSPSALRTVEAGVLGHELLTPLNAIVGYTELLREDRSAGDPRDLDDDLGKIHNAAWTLQPLISVLLDLAGAVKSGPVGQEMADAPFDVATNDDAVERGHVLIVDDNSVNRDLLARVLDRWGYRVSQAANGPAALRAAANSQVDLVLVDLVMPEMDGNEVCRRLRLDRATSMLPIVVITASTEREKTIAIEAGADDFVPKPFNRAELRARVRSLLRIKHYHDTIESQKAELADWNRTLEARVQQQVDELQRIGRLRRYLAPQVAELIVTSGPGEEALIRSHRQEVTVVFCDLRGFTAFAEATQPEELMRVLSEYHAVLGEQIYRYEGTLERFAGDGIMVFFNDPIQVPDHTARAVRMAVTMRQRLAQLEADWRTRGHQLGFGVGIALGEATLGTIGFDGRFDYAAIGRVTNLAARLCAQADAGQIVISQWAYAAVEQLVHGERVADLQLKGFAHPVAAYNIVSLAAPAT